MQVGNMVKALHGDKGFCDGVVKAIDGDVTVLELTKIYNADMRGRKPFMHEKTYKCRTDVCQVKAA